MFSSEFLITFINRIARAKSLDLNICVSPAIPVSVRSPIAVKTRTNNKQAVCSSEAAHAAICPPLPRPPLQGLPFCLKCLKVPFPILKRKVTSARPADDHASDTAACGAVGRGAAAPLPVVRKVWTFYQTLGRVPVFAPSEL